MRLLVAAGASGGGVYPALAVLQELEDDALQILWVGGEGGMEQDLVNRAGYELRSLPAAGLHGVGVRTLPGNLLKIFQGILAARKLLREFTPDALFFTGGFIAVPIALAGHKIPTFAFVPDIKPGLTSGTKATVGIFPAARAIGAATKPPVKNKASGEYLFSNLRAAR